MNIYLTIFGKPRYLGLARIKDGQTLEQLTSKWIVLKTSRGYEMGLPGGKLSEEQKERYSRETPKFEDSTEAMIQDVVFIREADGADIENYYSCRREEEEALLRARDILADHKLAMKLVDVEYMLDRKKFFLYFTSDQRVDFRAYVRDLAHEFRTRIEMRQVGIRDEARIVRGIASCGRPCCCGYWLRGFMPISIRIVKEQRTALNPTKISGLCGRLMCCMSYEQELYSEMWAKLPGPGAKIKTEQGCYILESLDLGREHVNIRFPTGRLVAVSINEFPDFKETVLKGEEWGIDKEMAEKKKAAQERIEMLEKRKERLKAKTAARAAKFKPAAKAPDLKKEKEKKPDTPAQKVKAKTAKHDGTARRRKRPANTADKQ